MQDALPLSYPAFKFQVSGCGLNIPTETMAKVLSTIITEDLSYKCKTNNLLPDLQFWGRPGCSTTDTLHYAKQYIKNSWHKGNVIVALFLDIQAAFPNM